jgi:hypothetical protein
MQMEGQRYQVHFLYHCILIEKRCIIKRSLVSDFASRNETNVCRDWASFILNVCVQSLRLDTFPRGTRTSYKWPATLSPVFWINWRMLIDKIFECNAETKEWDRFNKFQSPEIFKLSFRDIRGKKPENSLTRQLIRFDAPNFIINLEDCSRYFADCRRQAYFLLTLMLGYGDERVIYVSGLAIRIPWYRL